MMLALGSFLPSWGQCKLTPWSSTLVNDYRASEAAQSRSGVLLLSSRPGAEISPEAEALVTMRSSAAAAAIEAAGFTVESVMGRVAIVRVPMEGVDRLASMEQVVQISMGEPMEPMMTRARPASAVNEVQTGKDLPQGYDGSGVICGLMDTGLDPNHVNFRNSDGTGESRVKVLWRLSSGDGVNVTSTAYTTPRQIAAFTTDNSDQTHGTHVLGIMAGAYNGPGVYGTISTSGNAMQGKSKVPYYGVATGADIAIGCGTLYDVSIVKAVDNIVRYAESEGKPAVVNLSLGTNTGAHDGTDAVSEALSALGEKAIICVSAGNEGEDDIYIHKDFTSGSSEVRTVVGQTAEGSYTGVVDSWGSDATLFNASFVILDSRTGSTVYRYDLNRNLAGGNYTLGSSQYAGYSDVDATPAEFNSAFSGWLRLTSNVSPSNNRYMVSVRFNMSLSSSNSSRRYVPALIYSGKAGTSIDVFCNSKMSLTSLNLSGWTPGSPDNSANSMACGDNVLSIGSYTSRNSWPSYSGAWQYLAGNKGYAETYYPVGSASRFSSYGVQVNGKSVPMLCSPGCTLVSSVSSHYVSKAGLTAASMVAEAESTQPTRRKNYWDEMMGTSMASPYTAGVCALLLQADPTLGFDEVRDLLVTTARRDADVTTAANRVQWGAGKLDALAAMKKLLGGSSIGSVSDDDDRSVIISPCGDGYEVMCAGATGIEVTLHDMQGRPVATASATGSTATIATAGLSTGVYLLTAKTPAATVSRKIAVR